jgi:HPt (histidine-containing phosphotransfer) domain-containing protein
MNKSVLNDEYQTISETAHKITPSSIYIGVPQFTNIIKEMEVLANAGNDMNTIATLNNQLQSLRKIALAELKLEAEAIISKDK